MHTSDSDHLKCCKAPRVVASGVGSAGQRASATVVFGGMLSSTLLAIPFVPVFYIVMESMSEQLRRKKVASR